MARPQKRNAEYFSHDADMRKHRKVCAVGSKFGIKGYGVWCILLEILTGSDLNRIQLNDELEWVLLSPEFFGVTVSEIHEIIAFCRKIGLLSTETENKTEYLISESLRDRLNIVYERRIAKRENYRQSTLNIVSTSETPVSTSETTGLNGFGQRNDFDDNENGENMQITGLNTRKNSKNELQKNISKNTEKTVSPSETLISPSETLISPSETLISPSETTQSKVKYSKGKEKETKVSKEVREEEKLPLPFLDKNNKISTADRLSKLQSDGAYLDGLSTLKKIGLHELDILFRCFFEEQVSSGKAYNSDLDARKHFGSWLDATRNNHAGFIDGQIKKEAKRVQSSVSTERANISQKQSSIERANELLKTIKTRVDFIEGKVYSSGQEVSNEITGIKQNLLELGKVAESLPEHASKIGQSIEFANSKLNTFEAAIDKYVNPMASAKPAIDNLAQMLANKFGEA